MDRRKRTIIVVVVAVLVASAASFLVYRAIERIPVRQVEVASSYIVVASRALPLGTAITKDDVRLAAWPSRNPVPGSFASVDQVVNRGLIAEVNENEPITESRLAPVQAGAGIAPVIPTGMRAISVKVNEVIGVAGFVVPGTHVDVVVSVRGTGTNNDMMSRVVVTNVQVLTAGTRYDQQEAKEGKPIQSTVVTLLVLPQDAERIALASNEGNITLALRNPLDQQPTVTNGIRTASMMGQPNPEPTPKVVKGRRVVVVQKPVPPPEPPKPYVVEAIRAAKRTEESIK